MADTTITLNVSGTPGGFFVIARYCEVRRTWAGYAHHFDPGALNFHALQETIDAQMRRVTDEHTHATAAAAIGAAVTILLEQTSTITSANEFGVISVISAPAATSARQNNEPWTANG